MFTNSHQCVRQNLGVDDVVSEHSFGMNISSVLALLYVDAPFTKRDRLNLAELFPSKLAQVFVATQFCFL